MAFTANAGDPEPLWISYVDEVELLAQQGACYLELGLFEGALTTLTDAVTLMDTIKPAKVRDRVHYLSRIAKCHLGNGEIEGACAVGHEAIDAAVTLGSTRVLERLSEFNASLQPHTKNSAAHDFRERFRLFASAW